LPFGQPPRPATSAKITIWWPPPQPCRRTARHDGGDAPPPAVHLLRGHVVGQFEWNRL